MLLFFLFLDPARHHVAGHQFFCSACLSGELVGRFSDLEMA